MTFKSLDIKIKYDSDISDILNEFYIPVLAHSSFYYRISGFFSSTSLAVAASGLEDFIKNNGKMKLICSAILSKDDLEKMEEVYSTPSELLEEKFLIDYNSISNEFIKNNLAALGFMLANGNLEIKIAVPKEEVGMFHSKVGIMVDSFGDMISFSGSDNETASGWIYNIEEFKVFKSWVDGQNEYFYEDYDYFEQYWDNDTVKSNIIDLPEAISDKLIRMAPENASDVKIVKNIWEGDADTFDEEDFKDVEFKLRDYQIEAIDNWVNAGKKGIFEMATGTGKTFTGLGCMNLLKNEYLDNIEPLLIVIAAPTAHLVDQWEKDVAKFNIDHIIKAYSSSSWKNKISNLLLDLSIGELENMVILTTHSTVSKPYFREYLSEYDIDSFLIVDEVHGIGSNLQRFALDPKLYKYRLGLSATPKRWHDDEGNEEISSFFGDVVYEFSLSDALVRINPDTGETFLTPYEYHPVFIELTDEEFEDYAYYSSIIAQLYYKLKSKSTKNKDKIYNEIEKKQIVRQNILNKAENKFDGLKEVLSKLKNKNPVLKDLIIYCHDTKQLKKVNSILNDENMIKHKFTGEESIEERLNLLDHFSKGNIEALLAMKCLDEGVDVPSAKIAIIMASTSNPREYIQRRGRILRRSKGKNLAVIYDMIISFSQKQLSTLDDSQKKIELKIMSKEAIRYREFARDAVNYDYCLDLLDKYFKGVFK